MKCQKIEKLLSRSFDGLLGNGEKKILDEHLSQCAACEKKLRDYKDLFTILKEEEVPEMKPYFWERLLPKLRKQEAVKPLLVWKRWSLRAIPLSMLAVAAFSLATLFLLPQKKEELSPSEILLLRNQNPLQDTQALLDEGRVEDKNMRLIFMAMEEKNSQRRDWP